MQQKRQTCFLGFLEQLVDVNICSSEGIVCRKLPWVVISHEQLPRGLLVQLVEQRRFVPEVVGSNPTWVRDLFSLSAWRHFLSRIFYDLLSERQKVSFGIFMQHFDSPHLKPLYIFSKIALVIIEKGAR